MIKKIILCCLAFVIIALAAWNVSVGSQTEGMMSDVMLANVEALAQNEGDEGNEKICYFPGSTDYADYYACQSGYPNVKPCDNKDRDYMYFSKDKHVCKFD